MNDFPDMLSLQVRHFSPFSGSQVVRRVIVNRLVGIMAITTLIGSTASIIRTRYTEILGIYTELLEL